MVGLMCFVIVLSGLFCVWVFFLSWNVLNRVFKCFIRVLKFVLLFCGVLKMRKWGNFVFIFDLIVKILLVLCVGCFKENFILKFYICGLVCFFFCGFDV